MVQINRRCSLVMAIIFLFQFLLCQKKKLKKCESDRDDKAVAVVRHVRPNYTRLFFIISQPVLFLRTYCTLYKDHDVQTQVLFVVVPEVL
jgi:hypothetical protein